MRFLIELHIRLVESVSCGVFCLISCPPRIHSVVGWKSRYQIRKIVAHVRRLAVLEHWQCRFKEFGTIDSGLWN